MAHEIDTAAYSFKPAWHKLGVVLDHLPYGEEMKDVSGLGWLVGQDPVFVHKVIQDENGNPKTIYIEVPDMLGNVREDNLNVLGLVSKKYKVVQNCEAFDFVDGLHQDGIIRYEAAGSLKGGKVVWLLARMPEEFEVVAGDKLEQYILFTTAHDGSRAIWVMPTSVRVVCNNTLALATAKADKKALSIVHKGNIMDKLNDARKIIMKSNEKFEKFHTTAQKLAEVQFDIERLQALTEILIPKETNVNDTRRQKARENIMLAFTDSPQNLHGIRGTAWAAFNAVTQAVDHQSSYWGKNDDDPMRAREARMDSLLWGANARLKSEALSLITQAVLV